MSAVRILVDDVDDSVAAFELAGFTVAERWGPAFAILAAGDAHLWISGPETSAAKLTAQLPPERAVHARVRPVYEADDLDDAEATLRAEGWARAAGPITGPGGSQLLLERGSSFLEVFATRA